MVEDLVIHLGDCKTGTTSIQSALAGGAVRVDGAEIAYPTKFNHMPLAQSLSVPQQIPFRAERFKRVRNALARSDARHGVISAEHFEFVDPEVVADALSREFPRLRGRVRLIAYVRPHADRLVSTYAERVKKGVFFRPMTAMHQKFVEERLLFYTPRFERWRAVFGNAFTLRPFLRDRLAGGDVVRDFLGFVARGASVEIGQATQQNESLSVEDIAMMRALHVEIRDIDASLRPSREALGWYLSDLLAATPSATGTRPRLHRALARQVVETYAGDAAALDAAFFEGTPMSDALAAAPERAVDEAQSFDAADHFDAEQLRRISAVARIFARMMAADPAHFGWAVRSPDQRAPKPPR